LFAAAIGNVPQGATMPALMPYQGYMAAPPAVLMGPPLLPALEVLHVVSTLNVAADLTVLITHLPRLHTVRLAETVEWAWGD
jgi:hypothetical protein